jgi:hypothetical protein
LADDDGECFGRGIDLTSGCAAGGRTQDAGAVSAAGLDEPVAPEFVVDLATVPRARPRSVARLRIDVDNQAPDTVPAMRRAHPMG